MTRDPFFMDKSQDLSEVPDIPPVEMCHGTLSLVPIDEAIKIPVPSYWEHVQPQNCLVYRCSACNEPLWIDPELNLEAIQRDGHPKGLKED